MSKTTDADVDLYGAPPPARRGDRVYKSGSGYSGPGTVMCCFLGDDWHWRLVVEHQIGGGQGHFYHIYGRAQLRMEPEREHGEVTADDH
jgi:hypothetical protein